MTEQERCEACQQYEPEHDIRCVHANRPALILKSLGWFAVGIGRFLIQGIGFGVVLVISLLFAGIVHLLFHH